MLAHRSKSDQGIKAEKTQTIAQIHRRLQLNEQKQQHDSTRSDVEKMTHRGAVVTSVTYFVFIKEDAVWEAGLLIVTARVSCKYVKENRVSFM